MVSSVKSPPNHYDTLGLSRNASQAEIDEAYAAFLARVRKSPTMSAHDVRELGREVFAAYDTLRDPLKRRAYDNSLRGRPRRRAGAPAEVGVGPFIAASLRDPVNQPEASPDVAPAAEPESEQATAEPAFEPFVVEDHPLPETEGETWARGAEETPAERNRSGLLAGAMIVALGLFTLGVGLLWSSGERTQTPAPAPVAAPAGRPAPRVVAPPAPQQSTAPIAAGEEIAAPPEAAQPTQGTPAATPAEPLVPAPEPKTATPASEAAPEPAPSQAAQAAPPAATPPVAAQSAGIPAMPVVSREAPAKLVGGSLTKADNPRGHLRGTVTVEFTVGQSGAPSGCKTVAGDASIGARTCGLVLQRLRFAPALDAQGRSVSSVTRATYTWGQTHRPLLRTLFGWIRPARRPR